MGGIGQIIRDRYKLIAEIGRGGMSVVYLAKDINLDSYWAVKQVKNNSSVEFEAFLKEVELLAMLNNPDIPRIVDRIELGDDYFVVMDFVDGTSLAKILNVRGPQEEKTVVQWGIALCEILDYLHTVRQNPIVYRDMKPENVMLTPSGRLKLIDFGIAKECRRGERVPGESLGTRGFAAPEQYKGASNHLDERTDIYSLGATLFCLATGALPGKPPHGVPALRSVNSDLSDAFEYCIAKATADDPDNRYQSAAEFKKDLENIERLSRQYREKMKKRFLLFAGSLALSVVFALVGLTGRTLLRNELADRYQISYQRATAYERDGDYVRAATSYTDAIGANPEERDTYIRLFNALLPRDGAANAQVATMDAIDEMRNSYIDNARSPMYQDAVLMSLVARRCIEVQDVAYARYAVAYIELIKQSRMYEENLINQSEMQYLAVIASYIANDASEMDFDAFSRALAQLETYTDTEDLSPDERLGNYYMLIQMYSTYPADLSNAYAKAYEIGSKAREILERNTTNESMTFNNIIPLYELVAAGQYNSASFYAGNADKRVAYVNSLEWFGYLEDLGVSLSDNLAIKRANAHLGIYEIYNSPSGSGSAADAVAHLNEAITLFNAILANDANAFLPNVCLTKALLYRELEKEQGQRSMAAVWDSYRRAAAIAASGSNLDSIELMQFSSLKRQMQNAGLEV